VISNQSSGKSEVKELKLSAKVGYPKNLQTGEPISFQSGDRILREYQSKTKKYPIALYYLLILTDQYLPTLL